MKSCDATQSMNFLPLSQQISWYKNAQIMMSWCEHYVLQVYM